MQPARLRRSKMFDADPEGRQRVLQAAAKVFFEKGYEGASIDLIRAEVGGSRRTLYRAFGSKEGLFAAIVRASIEDALGCLTEEAQRHQSLDATLLNFGRGLMYALLTPTVLALYRIVVFEAARFPELAAMFYFSGPGHVAKRLARVLEQRQRLEEIGPVDCNIAADQFVSMIRGNLHLAIVLGLRPVPEDPDLEVFLAQAVGNFVEGISVKHRRLS